MIVDFLISLHWVYPPWLGYARGGGGLRAAGCGVKLLRGGLRDMTWQNLRCGLTAGQVTAGQTAGQEIAAGRAGS